MNRIKSSDNSLQVVRVIKLVFVVGVLCAIGLCYIMGKNQIVQVAEQLRQQEKEIVELRERNRQLSTDISCRKAPQVLQRGIDGMRLVGLGELRQIPLYRGGVPNMARSDAAPRSSHPGM